VRPLLADFTPTRVSASPRSRATTEILFPIADVVRWKSIRSGRSDQIRAVP